MIKLIMRCVLMGIGIALCLFAFRDNAGGQLALGGFMFGVGFHWHNRSFGLKSFLVGALMMVAAFAVTGAITTGALMFYLVAFVAIGVSIRMCFDLNKKTEAV